MPLKGRFATEYVLAETSVADLGAGIGNACLRVPESSHNFLSINF